MTMEGVRHAALELPVPGLNQFDEIKLTHEQRTT